MPSDVSEREQQDVATEGPTQKKYDRNKEATWYKKKDAPKILFVAKRDLLPLEFYKPGQKKEGLVPVHPYWRAPAWILCHSLPILFFQIFWYHFFPSTKWNTFFYWGYLFIAHAIFLGRLIKNLHWWIKFYGVLDTENSGRDIPRDPEAYKMSCDIFVYNLVRTAGVVFLGGYNPDVPPSLGFTDAAITPFTAVKMALWFLALDFFFYSYHRACHEIPSLWRIHSKHHATRHPTPLQAILASDFQEFLEIAVIPFLATYIVPMNSYELWLVMCTLVYIEALGHTGARAYWGHPILHPILDPFSLSLIIEDHDLHHRNGKSGKCFGKQSLLWDKLFGTVGKRIECVNEKVAF